MTEERQQQVTQPDGQSQQPAGQSSQSMQRTRGGEQSGRLQRGGFRPSLFTMDSFEMLRTSPFSLMRRFMEDMDNYLGQRGLRERGQGQQGTSSGLFFPPVEVFERDNTLVVRADLPGLTKDDVQVEVSDDGLTIGGERRSEHEEHQSGTVRSERQYGTFRRHIPLPEGVNVEQATATFKDGVLEVTMPAPPQQVRGYRIEIQSGAASGAGTPEASRESQEVSSAGH